VSRERNIASSVLIRDDKFAPTALSDKTNVISFVKDNFTHIFGPT